MHLAHEPVTRAVWTGHEMIVWGGECISLPFQHRRALRSGNRQLEAHEHAECTQRTIRSHGGLDGHEMIVWGETPRFLTSQHRRALRSGNRQLEADEHAECTQRTI